MQGPDAGYYRPAGQPVSQSAVAVGLDVQADGHVNDVAATSLTTSGRITVDHDGTLVCGTPPS